MRLSLMILACLLPVVCGCAGDGGDQPELATVSGQVTLDGKPLPNVILTFKPIGEGRSSSGVADEDGNYTLQYTANADGAMIATHRVKVAMIEAEDADATIKTKAVSTLPANASDGSMEKEVKPGSNTIDIAL